MAGFTGLSWRRVAPQVRQRINERLQDAPQLLHTRISLPYAVGIGAAFFFLPYVLWWLTATTSNPVPPGTSDGVEISQVLTALHTALAEPALGRLPNGSPAPFNMRDVEVELHFVVQKSTAARDDSLYRLVPVDTTIQTRPESVQTLKMHLFPTLPLPSQLRIPLSSAAGSRATDETGLRKSAPPKKRDRP